MHYIPSITAKSPRPNHFVTSSHTRTYTGTPYAILIHNSSPLCLQRIAAPVIVIWTMVSSMRRDRRSSSRSSSMRSQKAIACAASAPLWQKMSVPRLVLGGVRSLPTPQWSECLLSPPLTGAVHLHTPMPSWVEQWGWVACNWRCRSGRTAGVTAGDAALVASVAVDVLGTVAVMMGSEVARGMPSCGSII